MIELLIIGGIVSLLTVCIGVLLALRIQYRVLAEKHVEREAWEHARERNQIEWERKQNKRLLEIQQKLSGQVHLIHDEWAQWEAKNNNHTRRLRLEYTLNRLPRVEETPLSLDERHHQLQAPLNWEPPSLYRADLRERDFSQRYLGQADFREAQLAGTNFYMADLRGTRLSGANLSGANLIGANLSDADLRGTNLAGANLLVADLRGTVLNGANLLGVHNLTTQQIYEAIYDHTTQLDPAIDITLARAPSIEAKL